MGDGCKRILGGIDSSVGDCQKGLSVSFSSSLNMHSHAGTWERGKLDKTRAGHATPAELYDMYYKTSSVDAYATVYVILSVSET